MATTLVAIALALVLGLALSSASLTHLQQSQVRVNQSLAENAAEAILAEACERIVSNPEFGITATPGATLKQSLLDSHGVLSFHPATAEELGVPHSTSNRFGIEPGSGWDDTIVPPYGVKLYALGEFAGTKVVLEGLVRAPDFPYVVASSGPVDSAGALIIGRASSLEKAQDFDDLAPAALTSNGPVKISGAAQILGNIESTDSVTLGPEVKVQGESKPDSQPAEFQDLDIAALRPSSSVPLANFLSPELAGRYHHNGPSLRISGGLNLDDAVLFVNGDTHINGGITGKGAVIVNGSLTVEGSSSLQATTQVALVSQDDLRVTGTAQDASFFQGLVYTEGDFWAEDVTLVGAFLANKPSSPTEPGSQIQLQNVSLIQLAEYGKFDLDAVPFMIWNDGQKQSSGGREVLNLIQVDRQDFPTLMSAITWERQGTSMDEDDTSSPTVTVTVDFDLVASVSRGRRARLEDGKLVSEWTELQAPEIVEVLGLTQEPTTVYTESGPSSASALALLGFEASPDSPFWDIVHSSLHLDLNEFLGATDRVRRVSWRRYQ